MNRSLVVTGSGSLKFWFRSVYVSMVTM